MQTIIKPVHFPGHNLQTTAQIVEAVEQGLRMEHGFVSEQDIVFELLYWLDNCSDRILQEVYAQALEFVISPDYYPANDADVGLQAVHLSQSATQQASQSKQVYLWSDDVRQ